MNKQDARDTLLSVTQEAIRIYALNNPDWMKNYNAIRDERLSFINAYVMQHTTTDLRASVK